MNWLGIELKTPRFKANDLLPMRKVMIHIYTLFFQLGTKFKFAKFMREGLHGPEFSLIK